MLKAIKYLIGIMSIFLHIATSNTQMTCMGHPELCDRRLNEIAVINTHNGSSCKPSLGQNQSKCIADQLQDGVGSTKIPLHMDYVNPLGYYQDLLSAFLKKIDTEISTIADTINKAQADGVKKLTDAQNKVNTLSNQIADIDKKINAKKAWWNSLSKVKQNIQSIPHGIEMGALEASKKALELSKKAAIEFLEGLKKVVKIIDPNMDPRVLVLTGLKETVSQALKIAQKQGPEGSNKQVMACHGLVKWELYKDQVKNGFNALPKELQTILRPIQPQLSAFQQNISKKLFGPDQYDVMQGGLIPYIPCIWDAGSITFKQLLEDIKNYLDKNPDRIFRLILEDHTHRYQDIIDAFKSTGLLSYIHTQRKDQPWPYLKDMIRANKRLVVFWNDGKFPWEEQYPWIHNDVFFNAWVGGITDSAAHLLNPNRVDQDFQRGLGYKDSAPFNKFFNFAHSVTVGAAGDKNIAQQINQKNILRERVLRFSKRINRAPNTIALDFYELPNKDAFDVVDEINGVGKYKGKPLFIPQK